MEDVRLNVGSAVGIVGDTCPPHHIVGIVDSYAENLWYGVCIKCGASIKRQQWDPDAPYTLRRQR